MFRKSPSCRKPIRSVTFSDKAKLSDGVTAKSYYQAFSTKLEQPTSTQSKGGTNRSLAKTSTPLKHNNLKVSGTIKIKIDTEIGKEILTFDLSEEGHNDILATLLETENAEVNYLCNVCLQKFTSSADLKSHLQLHMKTMNMCHICFAVFNTNAMLQIHIAEHETPKSYICKICRKCFDQEKSLQKHFTFAHSALQLACEICDERFRNHKSLNFHMKNFHKEAPPHHACSQCKQIFASKATLAAHEKKHQERYRCNICYATFVSVSGLTSHVKMHKNMMPPQNSPSKKYNCDICGVGFNEEILLIAHTNSHQVIVQQEVEVPVKKIKENGTKPNSTSQSCLVCKKSFRTKGKLLTHIKSHLKWLDARCLFCLKLFKKKISLENHVKKSHKEAKYTCLLCSKVHKNLLDLKMHLRNHTKKVYKCSQCPKTFKSQQKLKTHNRVSHVKTEKFICVECMNSFPNEKELDIHEHTDSGFLRCPKCPQTCPNFASLQQHISSDHDRPDAESNICEECGEVFTDKDELKLHYEFHVDLKVYKCQLCDISFDNFLRFSDHILMHGAEMITDIVDLTDSEINKKFDSYTLEKLEFCGEQVDVILDDPKDIINEEIVTTEGNLAEQSEVALDLRKQDNNKKNKFSCGLCEFRFKDSEALSKHMNSHWLEDNSKTTNTDTNAGDKKSVADELKSTLQQRKLSQLAARNAEILKNLNFITKANTSSGTFDCVICSKKFASNDMFQYHVKTMHLVKKKEQGVNELAKLKTDLSAITFTCEVCNMLFVRSKDFEKHKKMHDKEPDPKVDAAKSNMEFKKFSCSHCKLNFLRQKDLQKHIKMSHSQKFNFFVSPTTEQKKPPTISKENPTTPQGSPQKIGKSSNKVEKVASKIEVRSPKKAEVGTPKKSEAGTPKKTEKVEPVAFKTECENLLSNSEDSILQSPGLNESNDAKVIVMTQPKFELDNLSCELSRQTQPELGKSILEKPKRCRTKGYTYITEEIPRNPAKKKQPKTPRKMNNSEPIAIDPGTSEQKIETSPPKKKDSEKGIPIKKRRLTQTWKDSPISSKRRRTQSIKNITDNNNVDAEKEEERDKNKETEKVKGEASPVKKVSSGIVPIKKIKKEKGDEVQENEDKLGKRDETVKLEKPQSEEEPSIRTSKRIKRVNPQFKDMITCFHPKKVEVGQEFAEPTVDVLMNLLRCGLEPEVKRNIHVTSDSVIELTSGQNIENHPSLEQETVVDLCSDDGEGERDVISTKIIPMRNQKLEPQEQMVYDLLLFRRSALSTIHSGVSSYVQFIKENGDKLGGKVKSQEFLPLLEEYKEFKSVFNKSKEIEQGIARFFSPLNTEKTKPSSTKKTKQPRKSEVVKKLRKSDIVKRVVKPPIVKIRRKSDVVKRIEKGTKRIETADELIEQLNNSVKTDSVVKIFRKSPRSGGKAVVSPKTPKKIPLPEKLEIPVESKEPQINDSSSDVKKEHLQAETSSNKESKMGDIIIKPVKSEPKKAEPKKTEPKKLEPKKLEPKTNQTEPKKRFLRSSGVTNQPAEKENQNTVEDTIENQEEPTKDKVKKALKIDKKFICIICKHLCQNLEEYNEHFENHGKKILTCQQCSLRFTDEQKYKDHQAYHETMQRLLEEFRAQAVVKSKILKERLQQKSDLQVEKKEKKEFQKPSTVEIPTQEVIMEALSLSPCVDGIAERGSPQDGSKDFLICKECNKKFATSYALEYHQMFHTPSKVLRSSYSSAHEKVVPETKKKTPHNSRNKLYICRFCEKQFKNQLLLSKHQRIHEHPYNCSVCGKSFQLKVEMNNHKCK